jgi:tripartite-type tricarboxylate transporter receptor subunit TctC
MRQRATKRLSAGLAALALGTAALSGCNQASNNAAGRPCDFFKGKNVNLVVPFDTGGGFDLYGRLVAKHLADPLGAKNVVVLNEPGAGGLLGTNRTWSAPPDGLRIQLMSSSGMITAELGGAEGVQFKSADFSWIGRITNEPDVVMSDPKGDITDVKNLKAAGQVRIGSSGIGDIDYVEANLLKRVFDLDSKIITGFNGAPEVVAAVARGEVDLFTASQTRAEIAAKAGDVRPVWVFSDKGLDAIPAATPIGDVVAPESKPVIEAQNTVLATGRALAAPPKMDLGRLGCLRDAFNAATSSADFKAEAKDLKLDGPIDPLDGEATAKLVAQVIDHSPQEYVDIVKASYAS